MNTNDKNERESIDASRPDSHLISTFIEGRLPIVKAEKVAELVANNKKWKKEYWRLAEFYSEACLADMETDSTDATDQAMLEHVVRTVAAAANRFHATEPRASNSAAVPTTETSQNIGKSSRRTMFLTCLSVAASILVGVLSYKWLHAEQEHRKLQQANAFLAETFSKSENAHIFKISNVSFLPTAESPASYIPVIVQNPGGFNCKVNWKIGEQEHTQAKVGPGNTTINNKFQAGDPITIDVQPLQTSYWLQPFSVTIIDKDGNANYRGISSSKAVVSIQAAQKVILRLEQPVPPWNAVMIRIDGKWALVTLDIPLANSSPNKQYEGADPDYPNCATYWAEFGDGGMAKALANEFIEKRDIGEIQYGTATNQLSHTKLIVPATEDELLSPFDTIDQEALTAELKRAFALIRTQDIPNGSTIQSEIDKEKSQRVPE